MIWHFKNNGFRHFIYGFRQNSQIFKLLCYTDKKTKEIVLMNARECIGKYGGEKIDDEQKEKIMNNLTNYCVKPSAIVYVLFALAWVVILA